MPLVTPSAFSPMTENSSPSSVPKGNTKRTPLGNVLAPISEGPSSSVRRARPALAEKRVASSSVKGVTDMDELKPRFPTAAVDVESISDIMAARLTTCLLGHVLFLKGQVPFPVAQLMKMSSRRKANERPNKKLDKLLSSFDVLSSHLGSTFTALANALSYNPLSTRSAQRTEKVHLAIVLGPSARAMNFARARVVLEFDGFRVAATRISASRSGAGLNSNLKENEGIVQSGSASVNGERRKGLRERVPLSDTAGEDTNEEEDTRDFSVVEPPPDSDSDSELESESDDSTSARASSLTPVHEETEADLSAAERLLSRTLAVANSDPELGMAADIRPTQIHILLHAPRRFSHPEWIPHDEISRKMDSLLDEFEEPSASVGDSQEGALHDITNISPQPQPGKEKQTRAVLKTKKEVKRKGAGGVKTDYVGVRSRGAVDEQQPLGEETEGTDKKNLDCPGDVTCSEGANEEKDEDFEDEDEEHDDELIWWSWADRLEGFTDL